MPIDVVVLVSPNPDKIDRVAEIIAHLAESAKAHEPYTLSYRVYRCEEGEDGMLDFVVRSRFEDEEAMIKRRELEHYKDMVRFVRNEDLLRKPLRYMKLKPEGGFDR